jgi:hypothetical protein
MGDKAITTIFSLLFTELDSRRNLLEARVGARVTGSNFRVANHTVTDAGVELVAKGFICIVPASTVILRMTKAGVSIDIDCSELFLLYGEPGTITVFPKLPGTTPGISAYFSTDT